MHTKQGKWNSQIKISNMNDLAKTLGNKELEFLTQPVYKDVIQVYFQNV